MKAEIKEDETILISAENITEAFALEYLYEKHKKNISKIIVLDGSILFHARNKNG